MNAEIGLGIALTMFGIMFAKPAIPL